MGNLWSRMTARFRRTERVRCPDCAAVSAVNETHCKVCGYDLVRQTRDDIASKRGPAQ